jgi:FtsH-binding integral membrane protein
MLLTICRYLALVYAVGLAIGEAIINSMQPHWQYAPLWIIDYLIVAYLLAGFWTTRRARYVPVLMSGYALSTGVMWMVYFLNYDPETPAEMRIKGPLIHLIGLIFAVSLFGLIGTTIVWLRGVRVERVI